MTDRELIEKAAKAAGIEVPITSPWGGYSETLGIYQLCMDGSKITKQWNPLNNDADASRLMVDCELTVCCDYPETVDTYTRDGSEITEFYTKHNKDKHAATRRAIVRAAAGE